MTLGDHAPVLLGLSILIMKLPCHSTLKCRLNITSTLIPTSPPKAAQLSDYFRITTCTSSPTSVKTCLNSLPTSNPATQGSFSPVIQTSQPPDTTSSHSCPSWLPHRSPLLVGLSHSLKNKFSSFQALVYSKSLDVIAVTESWLTRDIYNNEILPHGYSIFRVSEVVAHCCLK